MSLAHRGFIFFIFGFSFFLCQAEKTTVYGKAEEFAGFTLRLNTPADIISGKITTLSETAVDDNGNFSLSINIRKITPCFIPLEYYLGIIYLEPGKSYEIVLPPRRKLTKDESLSAFFTPENLYIGIKNTTQEELGYLIRDFDDYFFALLNQKIGRILADNDTAMMMSVIRECEGKFPDSREYYNLHKKYRYAYLKSFVYEFNMIPVVQEFFREDGIHENNMAYGDAFNQCFKKFYLILNDATRKNTKALINRGQLEELRTLTGETAKIISTDLTDLILIKMLFDAYYDDGFYNPAIENALLKISEEARNSMIAKTAQNVYNKFTRLSQGTPAPDFNLITIDGKKTELSDFKDKFLYINILNSEMISATADLPYLKELYKELGFAIEILSIYTDDNPKQVKEFALEQEINWTVVALSENDFDFLKAYNIELTPAYFLLDPEMKIFLSPAPEPTDFLAQRFLKILQSPKYSHFLKQQSESRAE